MGKKKKHKNKKILALDIAIKTGWALDLKDMNGVQDFKVKRGESDGMKFVKFKAFLSELYKAEKFKLVSYELPSGANSYSKIVAGKFIGVLQVFCEEKGIEYCNYSSKEIKSFATADGNANKAKMVTKAKELYKIEILDDNHADALHLYSLTKKELAL